MAQLPAPVIVIPGITATYLRDEYPLPPEVLWTVLHNDYQRITLHPDDLRYEALGPARVVPDQVFEVAYRELISELRYNLQASEEKPVPVYPFGYDWRQPLAATEERLAGYVREVIGRTKLLRHYDAEGYGDDPRVNIVAHSMGGLIAAGYIERYKAEARVGKVVSLATPFNGSFEAVLKITTGTAALGGSEPASRERDAARLMPALYHLIPDFAGALEVDAGLPTSLYDPGLWQPSVVKTLSGFIKERGLVKVDPEAQAGALFSSMLAEARAHRARLDAMRLADAGLADDDWLCVVGCGSKTRVRLRIGTRNGKPEFDLASDDRENKWGDGDPTTARLTGDGTVPFNAAVPAFVPIEKVVCVTPDDYGYWEVQDRLTSAAAGFHGILPNMDMLHRLIVRFFAGKPDGHKNTWGRPAPGVAAARWKPPLKLELVEKG